MTPKISNKIAIKFRPYIKRLTMCFCFFMILNICSWVFVTLLDNDGSDSAGGYIVALPHLGTIWCGGLLIFYLMFRELPDKVRMSTPVYIWNKVMIYPASIFFCLWFLVLSITTITIPFLLIYNFAKLKL